MIHVFCNKRGSGKTKALIKLANDKAQSAKGDMVYIDDDNRAIHELHRKIRFITTREFGLKDYESFYGFLCGILSENYDIDTIFIDGLSNIVRVNIEEAEALFKKLEKVTREYNLCFYINLNHEICEELPEIIKKYVA
ncbi:hypothetical protein [Clostridium hydrogeniformans]|uniref:hypothetical protein n=1 Tax=Clostridium hydrogeniformans TaxID=349933 RepID=UPI000482BEBE|nr:hypothetical protein [Clostridium hydrogeniformans]